MISEIDENHSLKFDTKIRQLKQKKLKNHFILF